MDTFLIYDCMSLFYSNNEMTVQLSLFYVIYVDSHCLEQNEITLKNVIKSHYDFKKSRFYIWFLLS